jgi:hypothetical protein
MVMYVDAESATQRDRQARQSKKGFWVLRLESAASMLYSFFRRGKRSAKDKKKRHYTGEQRIRLQVREEAAAPVVPT